MKKEKDDLEKEQITKADTTKVESVSTESRESVSTEPKGMLKKNSAKDAAKKTRQKIAALCTVPVVVAGAGVYAGIKLLSNNEPQDRPYTLVQKGTIADIKEIVSLPDGYKVVGIYKDEAMTIPYEKDEEIPAGTTVYVDVEKIIVYTISFDEIAYISDVTEKTIQIENGEDYSFTLNQEYFIPNQNPTVKVNGQVLLPVNNVYTIENVKDNIKVKVENIKPLPTLTITVVTMEKDNAQQLVETYSQEIAKNSELKDLVLTIPHGYDATQVNFYLNEEMTTAVADTTLLETHTTIYVELRKMTYSLLFNNHLFVEGLSTNEVGVEFGEDYSFSLYEIYQSQNPTVMINDKKLDVVAGVYTIKNVSQDLEIFISIPEMQTVALNLNIDGATSQIAVLKGATYTQVMAIINDKLGVNDFNSCGWFTDKDLTNDLDVMQSVIEENTIYTKKATNELKFVALEDGKASVSGCSDYSATKCVIPKKVMIENVEYVVSNIGDYAFSYRMNMCSLTMPSGIESIGNGAFNYCRGLTNIIVHKGVTSIGSGAFNQCHKLIEVINLSDLDITKGSTDNGNIAYYAKNVVTSLEQAGEFVVEDGIKYYIYGNEYMVVGVEDYSKTSLTIKKEATIIAGYAIRGSQIKFVTFEEDSKLKTIENVAFGGCMSLASIIIPKGVTAIGENAFNGCGSLIEIINLSSLEITKGSTDYGYIAYNAKNVATSLEQVGEFVVEDGVEYYVYKEGCVAFDLVDSTKENLILKKETTVIFNHAFNNAQNLSSVIIPEGVIAIDSGAFGMCFRLIEVINLSSLEITKGSTDNGNIAYYAKNVVTSLEQAGEFVVEDGIKYYRYGEGLVIRGLADSTQTDIIIKKEVTAVGNYAFVSCGNLKTVTLEEGSLLTEIGMYSFQSCSSLTSIVLSKGVTFIADGTFVACNALTTVYYEGTEAQKNDIYITSMNNAAVTNATWYYYSETKPSENVTSCWHYVDGVPTVWREED